MSIMTLTYFSKALIGCTQVNLYLPVGAEYEDMIEAGEKFQTLWLLHGHGGNYSEWARYTCIEKLAMDHKFAVVMPEGGHSFYSDQPNNKNYYTYITSELPAFLRKHFPLSDKREDNFIAGLSMGGCGAAKIGFANPDKYCAIGILSGGPVDPTRNMESVDPEKHAYREKYVFGPVSEMAGTPNDVWANFARLRNCEYPMPLIYNACGTDDFIFPRYLEFKEYAQSIGMSEHVIFDEQQGGVHSWDFWDEHITRFVDYLPLKNRGFWRKWYDNQNWR